MHKTTRDYAELVLGRCGASALSAIAFACIARVLGAEAYGQYALAVMVATVVATLLINWPNAAIVRFGREELARTGSLSETFASRLGLFGFTLLLAGSALYIFRENLQDYIGLEGSAAYLVVGGLTAAIALSEMCVSTVQAADRVRESAHLQVVSKAVFLALIGYAALAGADVTFILIACTAGLLMASGRALLRVRKVIGFRAGSVQRAKQMAGYTWALVFGGISGVVVRWVDLVVIKEVLGVAEVGHYSAAYQVFNILGTATAALPSLIFPLMVELRTVGKLGRIRAFIDGLLPHAFLAWNILLAFCVVLAKPVIVLLLGPDFLPAVLPLQILTLGLSFNAIGRAYTGITNAFDLLNRVAFLGIFVGLINLLGDILLIPILGIEGAAISTVFAFAVTHQSYIWLINRRKDLGNRRSRYRINFLTLIPGFVLGVSYLTGSVVWSLAAAFAASIAAVLLLRSLGAFTEEMIDVLADLPIPEQIMSRLLRSYRWLCT